MNAVQEVQSVVTVVVKSPVGLLRVVTNDKGLVSVDWVRTDEVEALGTQLEGMGSNVVASEEQALASPEASYWAHKAVEELEEYFSGKRKLFDIPVDLRGTPFQVAVWTALQEIPYGETRSYGEIAEQIGKPKAVRAVGQANRRNPVAVVIPCHRVVGSDGSLVGYVGSQVHLKSALLELEKSLI